jgi:molybdate transport system substrate-binding protein
MGMDHLPRSIARRFRTACLALSLLLTTGGVALADQITVFAAASLKEGLEEIAEAFGQETGAKIAFSFAGSSVLARQIELGAPADIFISANAQWMDVLEAAGAIREETRFDLLRNRLVLVAHDPDAAPVIVDGNLDLAGMLGTGRLAMGLVNAVPAGIYGKAALEHFGLWASVAGKVAQSDNVRASLALVALGEAPFGLVYATDAQAEPRVHVVATFPDGSHAPIVYPAALTRRSNGAQAHAFLDYLRGEKAHKILERQGFVVIAE